MEDSDDYIPKSDKEYKAWMDNFIAYAKAHLDELPISKDEIDALEETHDEWKIAYAASLKLDKRAKQAERELTKLTHKGKVDPRERMDGGNLPRILGIKVNSQLEKLTRQHDGTTLQEMMNQKKDHPDDE